MCMKMKECNINKEQKFYSDLNTYECTMLNSFDLYSGHSVLKIEKCSILSAKLIKLDIRERHC